MNAPGRINGALSPVSTVDSTDWSPITRYQSLTGADNPYSPTLPPNNRGINTPPTSVHSSTNITDGSMAQAMGRPPAGGNPSPPSSIARSSDGTGLYASRMADAGANNRKLMMYEDTLAEHYRVLKAYLGPYLKDEAGNPRPSRAKDKLTRLSPVQFQELSTDVYDESLRREDDRKRGGPGAPGNETPKYLLPKTNFHPKRNQARQKLSTLPLERFRQLATDVYYELERRCPRFAGGDIMRSASPAMSIASRTSRGPPSRVGTPNSMNGGLRGNGRPPPGPPGPYRNGHPPGSLPPGQANELGRPLPKTFQQNTIVPNKGTMVEDDDDDDSAANDDEDAFNLEGAASRQSRRQTNKSLNLANEKLVSDLQAQVAELQGKISSLEESLRNKDEEIEKLKEADQARDNITSSERAEWDDLRYSLEEKVEKAENLNSSLRSEIDRIRSENEETERNLRAQISELESKASQRQSANGDDDQWRQRAEELERELNEQQRVTEDVRRDAALFLQEMRELSNRSDAALEKEEQLFNRVTALEAELKDWKSRYTRAKSQLRSLKASSIGLASLASPDISNYARDASFTAPDGIVKDVHVTKFQLSIDELLQVARRSDPEQVLESMRHVVQCVRAITGDIDSTPLSQIQSPSSSVNGDGFATPEKQQAKLKSRVSATANNLITASKNHASSAGLSPVSLLDAAASHLSTAVVELVKHVRVRPTPAEELSNGEEDDRPMPLKPNGYSSYNPYGANSVNGNGVVGAGMGHQRHRSRGGSGSSAGYSAYSSPYSGYDRQSGGAYGLSPLKDTGMAEFKNYLDDQTALLVQSIQPLVHTIRSSSNGNAPGSSPADEQQIANYIQDISRAVQDTVTRTHDAVRDLPAPALKKHVLPIVQVLEGCRVDMLSVRVGDGPGDAGQAGKEGYRERIPPLAFRTARAMKELVLRVERIETGELTVDMVLKDDF
ncbi:uncharacterized protein EI97DRAFT_482744 [Westerdykella ornata]|uniref:GIT Spa2 homology (SHD) domain-containing protein n=1 Tax=Westerdykella ornata TaxID=318751 RepID=A0A6A6J971_WESOR|nr:uncharacterized protein EI97DRAFT_482744 [Westerdykella ornata]KAF2273120.1 hypothetical protein EI97DRAFT_482744 [Westerdykella ornata]